MQYRKGKDGTEISILAYGCMRFTKKNGKIDIDKTEQELMEAVRLGVNYFDTAYIYGGSEAAMGEIFERNHCREQIYIADKLPHYLIRSREGLEKKFQEQLKRLRTGYIDFYLMHMLTDMATWEKLKNLGIEEWIEEKLKSGQIRHIGFSYHGNADMFCRLVDAYDWDFCMIQYNYLDEYSPGGKEGACIRFRKGASGDDHGAAAGGKLVNLLPDSAKKLIAENPRGYTPAEWSFWWLWNQPEVTAVLSGMNSLEMLRENAEIASSVEAGTFTEEDFSLIEQVKAEINHTLKVGCTGCGYCMPCPKGVDIPGTFSAWNMFYSQGKGAARKSYMQCTIFRHDPSSASQCVGCGKCEEHCPQRIPVRKALKEAAGDLENIPYRVTRGLIRLLHMW